MEGREAPRVQKVQRGRYRPSGDKYICRLRRQRCQRQRKPYNLAALVGNAPFSPPTAVLPPKGETTHYILRVAGAPSKCVRCAPRRGKSTLRFPMESYGTLLSIHSSTAKRGGERWWRQPPKGDAFPRPKGGLPVFPRAKPSCKGFLILAPQAPTTTL